MVNGSLCVQISDLGEDDAVNSLIPAVGKFMVGGECESSREEGTSRCRTSARSPPPQ